MRKSVAVSAFVLAIGIVVCWFWATSSAQEKPVPAPADKPAAEKTPASVAPSLPGPVAVPALPSPAVAPTKPDKPQKEGRERPKGSSLPATASEQGGPAIPSPVAAGAPQNPGGVVQALGEVYGKAISDAVAAGYLKEEEACNLNREFETMVAIRKARLEVMRAIHVLEEGVAEDTNTKQGQEAKRLLEALRAALQLDQNPQPMVYAPGPVMATPATHRPVLFPAKPSSPSSQPTLAPPRSQSPQSVFPLPVQDNSPFKSAPAPR